MSPPCAVCSRRRTVYYLPSPSFPRLVPVSSSLTLPTNHTKHAPFLFSPTYLHPGFRSCQDIFVCPPVRHLFEVVRRGRVGRERAPRIVWSLKAARRSRTQPHAKDWAEDYITTVTTSWYTRPLHFQSTYFRCGRFPPPVAVQCTRRIRYDCCG